MGMLEARNDRIAIIKRNRTAIAPACSFKIKTFNKSHPEGEYDTGVMVFLAALLLLSGATGAPIDSRDGSHALQSENIQFRGHRDNDGERDVIFRGVVDRVTTKQHPHLSVLKKLLRDVSGVLTKHGVAHHITGGTLIGWKRSKSIIPVSGCCPS